MRTCEEPRPPNGQSPIALAAGQRSVPQALGFLSDVLGFGRLLFSTVNHWPLRIQVLVVLILLINLGVYLVVYHNKWWLKGPSLCSEYGFAEKVVEGMFIVVNSITIKIHSKAFHASFELWQLQGYSVNPNWQQSDLRLTRITDPQRGEVKGPCMSPIITCPEKWHSGLSRCSGLLGRCLDSTN